MSAVVSVLRPLSASDLFRAAKSVAKKNTRQRQLTKRSLVTDEIRPKMKFTVQIVCAIVGEWNFKFVFDGINLFSKKFARELICDARF